MLEVITEEYYALLFLQIYKILKDCTLFYVKILIKKGIPFLFSALKCIRTLVIINISVYYRFFGMWLRRI